MLSDQLVLSNLYNGKSQLVSSTDRGVLTQYQYDAIGNRSRQVLPMAPSPTPQNSRVIDYANLYEEREDGVYRVMTETSYNEAGLPLVRSRAELVSQLSSTLESKVVSTGRFRQRDNRVDGIRRPPRSASGRFLFPPPISRLKRA